MLGTDDVAQDIANKLIELGHEVMMGFCTSNNEKAVQWKQQNGIRAHHGIFNKAATFGERVFLMSIGNSFIRSIKRVDQGNLENKF